MARPLKDGLLYFPFDTTFFSDRKIRSLKVRFGVQGITLYLYILCNIYNENGYYEKMDEDFWERITDDTGIKENLARQIMNYFFDRAMLDSNLFKTVKILTSVKIQKTFQEAKKHLKREIEVIGDYWLLNRSETFSFIKVRQKQNKSEENEGLSGINPDKSGKNVVKQNKAKQNKANDIHTVVDYLNQKAGTAYRSTTANTVKHISARISEGYSVDDFKTVIDKKCTEWCGTEFEKFLRPDTLFGTKFEGYLNGKTLAQKKTNKSKFSNFTERNNDYGEIEKRMFEEMKKLGG